MSTSYLILRILLSFIPSVTAVCYAPNGGSLSDPDFQPCGENGTTSMCCAINRTNPSGGNYEQGYTADICLENGLCENKILITYDDGDPDLVTLYYRDFCTISHWKNGGGCLDVCTEQTNPDVGVSDGSIVMTSCDGTANSSTWCCGNSSSCCGTDSAISIAQTLGSGLPTTTTTSSSIPTIVLTTTAAATTIINQLPESTSSTSSSSSSLPLSGLSGSAKAGIGVGVSLGLVGTLAVALGLLVLQRRKNSRVNEESTTRSNLTTTTVLDNHSHTKAEGKHNDPIEHTGGMPASQQYELPCDNPSDLVDQH